MARTVPNCNRLGVGGKIAALARDGVAAAMARLRAILVGGNTLNAAASVEAAELALRGSTSSGSRVTDVAQKQASPQPVMRAVEDQFGLIFAAKTTASGLIALLVAFTFDLDEPYWALLTVFIVAQPRQSGQVLAKSFYRIIGTVIGAAVALLFVGLFAQERVLFLGALASWIGLCAFGSQYARNFAAYSFVLSGYTVAIVGIPGALDAGNAFYIATGRVTEVCLGIIAAATVNRIILPSSLGPQLWQAVADARATLADYAISLFKPGDSAPLRAKLLGQAIAIENLRASAIFEDREIRERSDPLRFLDLALIDAVGVAQLLGPQLDALGRSGASTEGGLDAAIAEATSAIQAWRASAIDAAALRRLLLRAQAHLPRVWPLSRDPSAPDEEVISRIAMIARLREFFTALAAYAEAYEAFTSARRTTSAPDPFHPGKRPGERAVDGSARRTCSLLSSAGSGSSLIGRTARPRRSLAPWRRRGSPPWLPRCRLPLPAL